MENFKEFKVNEGSIWAMNKYDAHSFHSVSYKDHIEKTASTFKKHVGMVEKFLKNYVGVEILDQGALYEKLSSMKTRKNKGSSLWNYTFLVSIDDNISDSISDKIEAKLLNFSNKKVFDQSAEIQVSLQETDDFVYVQCSIDPIV